MRLAQVIIRLRWPLLVLSLALWLGAGSIARDLEFNYSFWTLFVSDDPELVTLRAYRDQWGEDSALMFVHLRSASGDVLTAENLRIVAELEEAAAEIDGINEATSVLSVVTVRGRGDEMNIGPLADAVPDTLEEVRRFAEEALSNRLVVGTLLSDNRRSTVIALRVAEELRDAAERNPVVEAVEALAERVTAGSDMSASVTGIPVAQWVYSGRMVEDMRRFTSMSAILLAIILLVMFRSWVGLVLPLAVVAMATTLMLATMVLAGEPISMLTTALPTLMLVIGIADGIHLLAHYRQRLAAGDEPLDAVRDTFVRLGYACLLTSATTAVGFASLAVARIGTVNHFGIYAAIGIGYAFIGNMLIIPVGLALGRPTLGASRVEDDNRTLLRFVTSLARFTQRRPVAALALGVVVVVVSVAGMMRVRIESRLFEEISDDDPVVRAHRALEEDLPGVVSYALDVSTEPGAVARPAVLGALDEMARMAESHPAVDRAMGLTDLIEEMNRAMHGGDAAHARVPDDSALIQQYLLLAEGEATERIIDPEQSRTQVWMRGPEVTSSVWEDLRARLEARARELAPDVGVVVTGSSSMAQRALGAIIHDILYSLVGASIIILLMMSLLFRSLRLGLVSMIPNLVPLIVTVGWMGWVGINLRTSTVVIFSISLGLAVDDTIHFLVRYRRERGAGRTVEDAVMETFRTTGRPIVYTSLLLIGGFWILLLSSFNATRDVGLLGGVTLLSALFADLIILPALLALLPTVGSSGRTLAVVSVPPADRETPRSLQSPCDRVG